MTDAHPAGDRRVRRAPRRAPGRALAPALLLLACGSDPAGVAPISVPPALPPLVGGEVAIVGAHVVPMTGSEVLPDRTVIVRDGLIVEIGPSADVVVPDGADIVHGAGLWLIPGLADMHAHVRASELDLYRRAGVTTIRNMWGTPGVTALRSDNAAGADHPALFSAGPGVDGEPPSWPGTAIVTSPAAARDEVRRQATEGWDFIKVYNRLRPSVYDAILAEAAEVGIPVIGHVPLAADIDRASAGGQASVEHLTGIAEAVADGRGPAGWLRFDEDAAAVIAQRLAERGVWVCPTLAILAHLADRNLSPADAGRAREHQAHMVAALYDAGVPLLAGTDAGIDAVPAGSTLAVELELLVGAGLSPFEALRTATSEAARFLGIGDVSGTVEVGRRADLVLLTANPLEDIRAVREPVGLVQRGRVLFRPETPTAR